MFRLLCQNLIPKGIRNSTNKHVFFFHNITQSLASNSDISPTFPHRHSTTVSYLISNCGLSLDSAIAASQKIHIKTTDKPDSVLQLLKQYDLTPTQITDIVTKWPPVILANVKTLKPKLEFLESVGLSKPDIANIVDSNFRILFRSLNNHIIPAYNFLKRYIHSHHDIFTAYMQCRVTADFHLVMESNIASLQSHGVPEHNIGKLLMRFPKAVGQKNDRFIEVVKAVEEMRFDPESCYFVYAVGIMGWLSKSVWEEKLEAYKSFGCSEADIVSAFKSQPFIMVASEKKIRKLMGFYLTELGMKTSDVVKCPNLILISLEKRVFPRCSVLQMLLSNGLIGDDLNLAGSLSANSRWFEKKYVNKYQEIVPEVLKAYQGKLGYPRLETLRAFLQQDVEM